ncbi:hypothetical protein L6164_034626 [Bauhinia variegata]|uniref:Uncharacterized protein n=1 Tax=Bauhinia variegata TaxID=167791 RepID=A0ACB9KVQ8_BAUVA|nr:hypothetical protein L6164_034626 [Bauhinia variegata]
MKKGREMEGIAAANDGFAPKSAENAIGIPRRSYGGFPPHLNHDQGENDDLYDELWRACAGPSVYVPRAGEKVFYFPQGHLEQVAAFADQREIHMEMPVYDLPSKILCRVMCVQFKAEAHTDEVFAQVTLLPEPTQDELSSEDKDACRLPCRASFCSFSKKLTPSDTSAHGGFSIPRRHADECFPPLDISQQSPSQELIAKDLHGFEWHFRHIFRGHPRRHLLTSGWSTFVNSKKLVAGDACIFLSGENGELRIGIHRARKQHKSASTSASVISGHSMQLGILASASHAVSTGSMFNVYYHPWTNPSEFIIPLDQYIKSSEVDYSVGTRVQIRYGAEDFNKRRYAGTVIGVEEIDCARWPGSDWKCLKVQWDGILDTYVHPERVSPWSIEPLGSAKKKHISILPLPKRARALDPPLPGRGFAKEDIVQYSVKHAAQRYEKDLQGQDYNEEGSSQHAQPPPSSTNALLPSNVTSNDSQLGMKSQLQFVTQNPLHQSLGNSIPFSDDDISTSSLPSRSPVFTTYGTCNNVSVKRDISISNVNSCDSESHGWRASESRDENEVLFGHPHGYSRYKLFGFNLIGNHPELPSPQLAAYSKNSSPPSVTPMSQSSVSATIPVSEPSKSISGVTSGEKNKKYCSVNSRSCTKVLKHGTALGRSIDLARFPGYEELIAELDRMFDFGGSLINGSSGWQVAFTDDDGDMMLLGDYPWQDFQSMVQKMIIRPKEGMSKIR